MTHITAMSHTLRSDRTDADKLLDELRPVAAWLQERDPVHLSRWYLTGYSRAEALRYEAFSSGINGDDTTRAALRAQFKGKHGRFLRLWNGSENNDDGATLCLRPTHGAHAGEFELDAGGKPDNAVFSTWEPVAELLAVVVRQWRPVCGKVYDNPPYKPTFPDRPGVGWMLYLPIELTASDVPEAAALVPVNADGEHLGTIIVSTTDSPFDYENKAHLKRAHDMEVRLVSQNQLPTYTQMLSTR